MRIKVPVLRDFGYLDGDLSRDLRANSNAEIDEKDAAGLRAGGFIGEVVTDEAAAPAGLPLAEPPAAEKPPEPPADAFDHDDDGKRGSKPGRRRRK